MAIAAGNNNTTSNTIASTSLALKLPTGVVDGNLMVMAFGCENDGGITVTLPSGWNLIINQPSADTSTSSIRAVAAWRIAASEPGTDYVVTFSSAVRAGGSVQVYTGADTTTPIDVAAAAQVLTGAGTTVNGPSVTTVTDGAWAITFAVADATSTATWTTPTGYNSRWAATGRNTALADLAFPTAGATGAATWTNVTGSLYRIGVQFAIRPAGAGAATGAMTPSKFWGT